MSLLIGDIILKFFSGNKAWKEFKDTKIILRHYCGIKTKKVVLFSEKMIWFPTWADDVFITHSPAQSNVYQNIQFLFQKLTHTSKKKTKEKKRKTKEIKEEKEKENIPAVNFIFGQSNKMR